MNNILRQQNENYESQEEHQGEDENDFRSPEKKKPHRVLIRVANQKMKIFSQKMMIFSQKSGEIDENSFFRFFYGNPAFSLG